MRGAIADEIIAMTIEAAQGGNLFRWPKSKERVCHRCATAAAIGNPIAVAGECLKPEDGLLISSFRHSHPNFGGTDARSIEAELFAAAPEMPKSLAGDQDSQQELR